MRKRCSDPGRRDFADYGGRGIAVCARWGEFENFLADMGQKPAGHTIERIDNDRGYEPENCRWATAKEQARNRRSNERIKVNGELITISEAAERLGLRTDTVWKRLKIHNWTPEQLFDPAFSGVRHRWTGPHAAANHR